MSLKLVTIVGTRPELIKLSEVIKQADHVFNHTLIHTGQNYDFELNEIFYEDLGLRKPNYFLECADETQAKTIAKVITKSDEILREIKPDALLLYGDTNSCLACISAKKLKIPIFHLEAGNRCFDLNVPEEVNRKIVDHMSDINLVHSKEAKGYLLNEGIRADQVIECGSPMYEIINKHSSKIKNSKILERLNIKKSDYFLVSLHREENVDKPESLTKILNSIKDLTESHNCSAIFSLHPRTSKMIEKLENFKVGSRIKMIKPVGFSDYLHLQLNSKCVLSDSGTITEESSVLGFPAVMVRNTHERPEGMNNGVAVLSGTYSSKTLSEAVELTLNTPISNHLIDTYRKPDFSANVVRIIQSYTHYINNYIWRKNV